jgi:1-acyl-sn-glycerol-3-phosphate acyltransferase
MRAFRVRIVVEGAEVLTPGPILIFMRHTSVADTLAPANLISRPASLHPRFVMKRTLLWSPGINVMGTRNVNCFVERGAGGESRFVGMLADDMGPRDAVLIYPEGMVLTPARAAAMQGDAHGGSGAGDRGGARAERDTYQRVQKPRLGGPLALLERATGKHDVVFVGHVGLEVAPGVRQLLRGDLMDARVRFRMWRAPASEIPASRPKMADWLRERWHEMDDWVAATQDEMGVRRAEH